MEEENHDFVIYFASQTGTAENFAAIIKKETMGMGLSSKIVDLAIVTEESFIKEKNAVFLMATHYEGDPPDNAEKFWGWFSNESKWTSSWLEDLKFTVFALGDTTYEETFAKIGQETNRLLNKYGARNIYKLGVGSDDDDNIIKYFNSWKEDGLLEALQQNFKSKKKIEISQDDIIINEIHEEKYPFSAIISSFHQEMPLSKIRQSKQNLNFEAERFVNYHTLPIGKTLF